MAKTNVPILHFNDVYRVSPQKIGNTGETIDVTQFAALVETLREKWDTKSRVDGSKEYEGLVLFSGDLFSPSVESTVTRGSHMVPVMNEIGVDVALTGNHDFDFGYPHLTKLVQDSTYPWILSNIIDETTGQPPKYLQPFQVFERCGVRIGIIGLVEEEWITTVATWPSEFQYKDMATTGLELSKLLRDPNGEYRCDIILALTHSRVPNDIELAKKLLALSSSAQSAQSIANEHGVDILFGGHDHHYFVSRGVDKWEGYDKDQEALGAEEDKGDILIVKSGCDFRDLSEVILELEDTPEGSIRRKVISRITGKHHITIPGMESSERMTALLKDVLSSLNSAMKAPVCKTTNVLDLRSHNIRINESASGNWFADIIRHCFDDALCMKGRSGGSDGVFICAGTLRGDSTYGPGVITLGDILEILPFQDSLVVLELDGETIWGALEVALETWPAFEGRFPVISGFKVTWDSRRPPGQRVVDVVLLKNSEKKDENGSPEQIEEHPILRQKDGRKYNIVTRQYLAEGHDGFLPLKGQPYLIDDENGVLMSSVVRKYLLGCQFVRKMTRLSEEERPQSLLKNTHSAIRNTIREQGKQQRSEAQEKAHNRWKQAFESINHHSRSSVHYQSHLNVSMTEHMSSVDPFDGLAARQGRKFSFEGDEERERDLLVISPEVDGRLKDIGRESSA